MGIFLVSACDLHLYCHFITLKHVWVQIIYFGHTRVHVTLTSDVYSTRQGEYPRASVISMFFYLPSVFDYINAWKGSLLEAVHRATVLAVAHSVSIVVCTDFFLCVIPNTDLSGTVNRIIKLSIFKALP